jgi:hypothetical protein
MRFAYDVQAGQTISIKDGIQQGDISGEKHADLETKKALLDSIQRGKEKIERWKKRKLNIGSIIEKRELYLKQKRARAGERESKEMDFQDSTNSNLVRFFAHF